MRPGDAPWLKKCIPNENLNIKKYNVKTFEQTVILTYFSPVTLVMYAISCYILPLYNGTRLYLAWLLIYISLPDVISDNSLPDVCLITHGGAWPLNNYRCRYYISNSNMPPGITLAKSFAMIWSDGISTRPSTFPLTSKAPGHCMGLVGFDWFSIKYDRAITVLLVCLLPSTVIKRIMTCNFICGRT